MPGVPRFKSEKGPVTALGPPPPSFCRREVIVHKWWGRSCGVGGYLVTDPLPKRGRFQFRPKGWSDRLTHGALYRSRLRTRLFSTGSRLCLSKRS